MEGVYTLRRAHNSTLINEIDAAREIRGLNYDGISFTYGQPVLDVCFPVSFLFCTNNKVSISPFSCLVLYALQWLVLMVSSSLLYTLKLAHGLSWVLEFLNQLIYLSRVPYVIILICIFPRLRRIFHKFLAPSLELNFSRVFSNSTPLVKTFIVCFFQYCTSYRILFLGDPRFTNSN